MFKTWDAFIFELELWAKNCPMEMEDKPRIMHMREEVQELFLRPNDPMEMADIGIILLKHCYAHNVDLLDAMQVKFKQIKNSEWQEPDADGIVHRIK